MSAMSTIAVVPVERLELRFVPRPWPFAQQRRAEIDARFAQLQQQMPGVWNGQVLMMGERDVAGSSLRAELFPVDYASFLVWHDWGCPETGARNAFALGALHTSDGAFLLGEMAPHTANRGLIYFPCGTPDPTDVVGTQVDFDGSVGRELAEETGLMPADYVAEPGWHIVFEGPRIACVKIVQVSQTAEILRDRILGFLARERQPELCDIRIVRGPADFDPKMPAYVPAFLEYFWAVRIGRQ